MSLFNKAKDKIRKKDNDELSRSSSLMSRLSRSSKTDKEKEKKRLSGLKYDKFSSSKESVNSIASSKKEKEVKAAKTKAVAKIDKTKEVKDKVKAELNESKDKKEVEKPKEADIPVKEPETKLSEPITSDISGAGELEGVATGTVEGTIDGVLEGAPIAVETNTQNDPQNDTQNDEDITPIKRPTSPGVDPLTAAPVQVFRASTGDLHLKDNYHVGDGTIAEPRKTPTTEPVTETTPLIRDLESQTVIPSPFSTARFTIAVILILAIVLSIVYFTYFDSNVVIQQSIHPQLNSINLLGLSDSGIDIHVNASVRVNYDNITNSIYHHLYRLGGMMIGSVMLSPNLPIKVKINDLNSFDVSTPKEFSLNLTNGANNILEFNSTVSLNDANLIGLLNDLMENEVVDINLKSRLTTGVIWGYVKIPKVPISIDQNLTFNADSMITQLSSVSKINVNSDFGFQGDVKVPGIINEFINNGDFNLLIKDCDNKLTKIGAVKYLNESISGQLSPFPEDNCNLITNLINDYLNGISKVYMNSTFAKTKKFPDWLINIVNNVNFRLPKVNLSFSDLPEYNMTATSIEYTDLITIMNNISMDSPIEFSNLKYTVENANGKGKGFGSLQHGEFINYLEINPEHQKQTIESSGKKFNLSIQSIDIKSPIMNTSLSFNISDVKIPKLASKLDINVNGLNLAESGMSFDADLDIPGLDFNLKQPLKVDFESGSISVSGTEDVKLVLNPNEKLSKLVSGIISHNVEPLEVELKSEGELSVLNGIKLEVDPTFVFPQELITDPIIHILTSEIEITVYNPINHDLLIDLQYTEATYKGTKIGEISAQTVEVNGGDTRVKLPIKLNQVGLELLRKALNNDLKVDVTSEFIVNVNDIKLPLEYDGIGLTAGIRL